MVCVYEMRVYQGPSTVNIHRYSEIIQYIVVVRMIGQQLENLIVLQK